MKRKGLLLNLIILSNLLAVQVEAQRVDRKMLTWEQRQVDIGPILEENGPVTAEFFGRNLNSKPVFITDVISDCGCTTVEFTKDTLTHYMIASIKVQYDPVNRGGYFSKLVIVRTSEDIYGDSLYLEGFNMPVPELIETAYPHKVGNIGFRLPAVNMGEVFTNEPKVKYVELYNFGNQEFSLNEEQPGLPDYLKVELVPDTLNPEKRGLLAITYDGAIKDDLGHFEEQIDLDVKQSDEPLDFKMFSVVYDYFPPLPKSMEDQVAKLGISDTEVNLGNINSNSRVTKSVTLSNLGLEPLDIRKISTNCDCLEIDLENKTLFPEETARLAFTFDPKGRKGIDHKHITIFSTDPLHPVRTIVVRSSIK